MARVHEQIDARLAEWIRSQQLFFVGTAPSEGGHVNVSPKGPIGSLAILDGRTVAYLDLVGSGIETVAHLRENGRIVLMLCAFAGAPRIVRLHGRGRAVLRGEAEFGQLAESAGFAPSPRARSIVVVDVERIADSCGYGVPLMRYQGERTQGAAWAARKLAQGETALEDYAREHNAASIDGLPGLE